MPDARLSVEASAHYSLIFPFGLTSVLGKDGHAACNARCPLSGAKRKTYPRSELIRFLPNSDLLAANRHNLTYPLIWRQDGAHRGAARTRAGGRGDVITTATTGSGGTS